MDSARSVGATTVAMFSDIDMMVAVETIATFFALFFLTSPLFQVMQVHFKRGEGLADVNPLNLLSIYANCGLWLIYAVYFPMPPAVSPNLVGILSSLLSLGICGAWALALRRRDARCVGGCNAAKAVAQWGPRTLLLSAGLSLAMALLTAYASNEDGGAEHVGYMAMIVNIFMFAAPLSVMADVLREKRSNKLPWLQCVLGWGCSSLWFVVGFSRGSTPMAVPNLLGSILSAVQVFLIFWFPARSEISSTAALELGVPVKPSA